MKKALIGAAMLSVSSASFAVAPGGDDCGWGNLLFEGKSGLPYHLLASIVNGTSGNATFGMTSGTNGCEVDGDLTYGGESMISAVMDEFSEDVARGEGEALNAVAVTLNVGLQDRAHFAAVMHQHFTQLFPNAGVTAAEVTSQVLAIMQADARLAQYVS